MNSLGANLAVFLLSPLLLNGVIFSLRWDRSAVPNPYLPPGWVVGTIWMLLFAAMGTARWLLLKAGAPTWPVTMLAVLCMLYPLYTEGLRNDRTGLAGALVTGVVALYAVGKAGPESSAAAGLLSPVVLWLGYASAALWRGLRLHG